MDASPNDGGHLRQYRIYTDAVWDADPDDLPATLRIVALCYAKHAHNPPYDRSYVTDARLMQQCGFRTKKTAGRTRDELVAMGWLTPLHPETGSAMGAEEAKAWQRRRKSLPHMLTIPSKTADGSAPPEGVVDGPGSAPPRGVATPSGEVEPTTLLRGAVAPLSTPAAPLAARRYPPEGGLTSTQTSKEPLSEREDRNQGEEQNSSRRPDPLTGFLRAEGIAEADEQHLWDLVRSTPRPGRQPITNPRAWMRTCIANGDTDGPREHTRRFLAPQATQAPENAPPALPPHCGVCGQPERGEDNPAIVNPRLRRTDGGKGPRCPQCHPNATEATA